MIANHQLPGHDSAGLHPPASSPRPFRVDYVFAQATINIKRGLKMHSTAKIPDYLENENVACVLLRPPIYTTKLFFISPPLCTCIDAMTTRDHIGIPVIV